MRHFSLNPLAPPSPLRAKASNFTLSDVTLVEPSSSRSVHQDLHVENGKIEQLGKNEAVQWSHSGLTDAYKGAYVLPGLVDMHMHLPPANALNLTEYFAFLYLAHGVTTIRDSGDMDGTAVAAAKTGIAKGQFPGPRVLSCGPFLSGYPPRLKNSIVIQNPGDAEAAVRKVKEGGFDFVKSYDYLTLSQLEELKRAAKSHGLGVMGHVPAALAYEEALIPEVQHFYGVPEPSSIGRDHLLNRAADWQDVDDARIDYIVEVSLKHDIANTPTLVVTSNLQRYLDFNDTIEDPAIQLMPRMYREVIWHPTEGIPWYHEASEYTDKLRDALIRKQRLVKRLHRNGATVHLGTDVPLPFNVPGGSLHEEMRLFHESGIGLDEVWQMATIKAGHALKLPLLGTLEQGAPADLLIFRGDPTSEWSGLTSLEAVVAQGLLYTKQDIDNKIEEYQRHFKRMIFDRLSVAASRKIMRRLIKTAN